MRVSNYGNLFTKQLELMRRTKAEVKPETIIKFLTTIDYASNRDIDTNYVNGYSLVDYRLDARFLPLVVPCRVAISPDRVWNNLRNTEEINTSEVVTPTEFIDIQTEILALFRQNLNLSSNLKDASDFVTFDDVHTKQLLDDTVHWPDDGVAYMPVDLILPPLAKPFYFNYPVEDLLSELFRVVTLSLTK